MNNIEEMEAIDIARRFAELGQVQEACQAYTLAIARSDNPNIHFEASLYILENGGNYQVSYDALLELCKDPDFKQTAYGIITEAFYLPNEKQLKTRYEKNCKLLQKYPYMFRKDFPRFEELPIRFYPFDDNFYVPFDCQAEEFQGKVNFHYPEVTHYFFENLDDPILAHDIVSEYELEYLRDNVRSSEYVSRDNHIYLHYTNWERFCSYLQVWNLREILEEKKFVFLIENEIQHYPIDFKKEFKIDYSQFPLKPVALPEIKKMIWHTQLSSHNGGDFFNEVLDNHPNLITTSSVLFDDIEKTMEDARKFLKEHNYLDIRYRNEKDKKIKLDMLSSITSADIDNERILFLCVLLIDSELGHLDLNSRIVPAIMFQPHFEHMVYKLEAQELNRVTLSCKAYDGIQKSSVFKRFPYLKTFTPMRRPTTSGAATLRFQISGFDWEMKKNPETYEPGVAADVVLDRIFNRSYMVDSQNRLFQDSVLVRFEDGKLNPKATFTALAEFLDIPYTDSMTYCSQNGDAGFYTPGNAVGFSADSVYRTYDEFLGKPERTLIEYFMRDTYEHYGYNFQYYDGEPMDPERIEDLLQHSNVMFEHIWKTYSAAYSVQIKKKLQESGESSMSYLGVDHITPENVELLRKPFYEEGLKSRKIVLANMLNELYFVNEQEQPLQFMKALKLNPELLETPIYH